MLQVSMTGIFEKDNPVDQNRCLPIDVNVRRGSEVHRVENCGWDPPSLTSTPQVVIRGEYRRKLFYVPAANTALISKSKGYNLAAFITRQRLEHHASKR